MKKLWDDEAWKDYLEWQKTDKKIVSKINTLLKEIERTPFRGLGKPEPLKENRSGLWSRRITEYHRLVYRINDNCIEIISCNDHYDD